jgi:hypothetical protein
LYHLTTTLISGGQQKLIKMQILVTALRSSRQARLNNARFGRCWGRAEPLQKHFSQRRKVVLAPNGQQPVCPGFGPATGNLPYRHYQQCAMAI